MKCWHFCVKKSFLTLLFTSNCEFFEVWLEMIIFDQCLRRFPQLSTYDCRMRLGSLSDSCTPFFPVQTEFFFWNLIKLNRKQIVFTIFWLIRNTNGHCPFAVPTKLENGKYNLNSVWFNTILKRFLCVWDYGNILSGILLIIKHVIYVNISAICNIYEYNPGVTLKYI